MNPEERKKLISGSKRSKSGGRARGKNDAQDREGPQTFQEHVISWGKTILGALAIVMVVNGLLIQSFVVPTESMEDEVLAGDFVFVNRIIYGGSTPQTIPFLNIPLPYLRLPGFSSPEKGDVIVFIYPGDRDQVEADAFQYYLKRCVAVAGDTLHVTGGYVHVNGVRADFPSEAKIDPSQPLRPDEIYRTFPRGAKNTRDEWGPMRIPKEGDKVELNDSTYQTWETFVQREGHDISRDGTIIKVDGEIVDSYEVEKDYVFGMGDNRNNSLDSRYWGFVPEENVVGTPITVYWSWQNRELAPVPGGYELRELSIFEKFGKIRWNRIFKGID